MVAKMTAAFIICAVVLLGPGTSGISSRAGRSTADSMVCNTTGAVRLVNGCDSLEGRVEVCYEGQWGTVCDDRWSNVDAGVVCTQLGFPGPGAIFFREAFFGEGTGPIWLDEVKCVGDEQQILDCSLGISEIGGGDCRHSEDAGVRCPSACICGELRLSGSDSYYEGRVEVCSEGVFETVIPCDENWQGIHAQVVCQQLGFFNPGHIALGNSSFTSGITGRRHLENLSCNGDEATFRDCSYTAVDMQTCSSLDSIAAVRCAVTNVTFIPFGAAAGDNEVTLVGSEVMSLGPFDLETPLVFYLQQENQLYITSNGVFSFEEVSITELQSLQFESSNTQTPSQSSSTPLIATLWTLTPSEQDDNRTLYTRVAQDNTTLGLARDMIAAENTALSDYQPTVAIVVTWTRELMEVGQVILSSNGRASFATFLLNDGEGLRALETSNLLYFGAGDGLRSHRLPRPASLMALQNSPRSFRIDGDHVAAAESACILSAFTIGFVQLQASFFSCSCYLDLVPSQMDSGIPFTMCVPGSVPTRSSGQLLSCHPIYLPCLIMDSCPANSSSLNCSTETSDFIPFGRGVGDTLGPHEDDAVAGPLNLIVPVMYFGREHTRLFVTTNGYVSFDGPFNMADSCRFLPCSTDVPIIAPIWIDLDFRRFGLLYYRVSQDSATLERVRDMIVQQNPATLSAYQPTLAVIVTWFEAQPGSIMMDDTFQLIVSTDGEVSFSTWIFNDSQVLPPLVNIANFVLSGFDGSFATGLSADVGEFLKANRLQLPPVSFYRIDGTCITTASPDGVCHLDAVATECADFNATVCTCGAGFHSEGLLCTDINECLQVDVCDENAACQNTEGSFICSCRAGFFGNGTISCSDVNECDGDRNPCGSNSICFNTLGSFSCTCERGFIMTGDSNSCQAGQTSVPLSTVLPAVLVPVVFLILLILAVTIVMVVLIQKRHKRIEEGIRNFNQTHLQKGEQRASNEYFETSFMKTDNQAITQ